MSNEIRSAYAAVVHGVLRCLAVPRTPQEQLVALLDGLRDCMKLRVVIAGLVRCESADNPPARLHTIQVGDLGTETRRFDQQALVDLSHRPDPSHLEASRRFASGSGVARRQDLVQDDAWYAAAHVVTVRREMKLDACMHAWAPIVHDAGSTIVATFSLHRAWGEPQFSEPERDAVQMLLTPLEPLLRTWHVSRGAGGGAIDLPRRLRGVLARLLQGDSEKAAATKLGLSPHTVHQYIKFIHSRLGVKSRGELLAWCAQRGVTAESIDAIVDAQEPGAPRKPRRSRLIVNPPSMVEADALAQQSPAAVATSV